MRRAESWEDGVSSVVGSFKFMLRGFVLLRGTAYSRRQQKTRTAASCSSSTLRGHCPDRPMCRRCVKLRGIFLPGLRRLGRKAVLIG